MKLKKITIHKFKSINTDQSINIEDDITILVGMNESGKTACLEAMAKTNYHQSDGKLSSFSETHDYPRRDRTNLRRGKSLDKAITCEYEIDKDTLSLVEQKICPGILSDKTIIQEHTYKNGEDIFITTDYEALHHLIISKLKIPKDKKHLITDISDRDSYNSTKEQLNGYFDLSEFDYLLDEEDGWDWDDFLGGYVYKNIIEPRLPKFLYYNEYYSLPHRVLIGEIASNSDLSDGDKTAQALLELARIDINGLVNSEDFEDLKAELEPNSLRVSNYLFKYWGTNNNLEIVFDIDNRDEEYILDIRIKNIDQGISLPLTNKSKGFNWFFSFLVWFKKIQEDEDSNYILLLDEPGLNLHASAQSDLLKFLEDLAKDSYQIIYTTHSPFMIDSGNLHRVRTVFETDSSTRLSDSIQEKDPNTLFPLQAALGYDIAQNLFVGNKNLLVEGISDLIYLEVFSNLLKEEGRQGLDDSITIVPVGGLEKVSSFISLLRGNKLKIICLLDSPSSSQEQFLRNVIERKLIQRSGIRYFHEFIEANTTATIEDLFDVDDYLELFNATFKEKYQEINASELPKGNKIITKRIDILLKNKNEQHNRFNHYSPANFLSRSDVKSICKGSTLDRFEKLFKTVNELYN